MKNSLLIFYSVFISVFCNAQSHLQWSTTEATPGSQANIFKGMNTDAAGNTYVINFTQSNSNFWFTYRFFAYNTNGIKLWQYDNDSCFTNCIDQYHNIIPIDNSGAIFIGTYDDTLGNKQIRIKRIDMSGNLIWQKSWNYPFLSGTFPIVAKLDNAGNIVMGMSAFMSPTFSENFAFAKFDTIAGNELWHFELPDQGPNGVSLTESFSDIVTDANNNIYFTGDGSNGLANIGRNYYFSVSPAGSVNYFNFTDYLPLNPSPNDLCINNSGFFYRLIKLGGNMFLQKVDTASGNMSWALPIFMDSAEIEPVNVIATNSNLYVLSNYTYFVPDSSFPGGHWLNRHYFIAKYDLTGGKVWQKTFFESFDSLALQNGSGGAKQLLFCNNNLFVISDGFIDSVNARMFLTKMDTAGTVIWYDTTSTGFSGPMAVDAGCNVYVSRSMQPAGGGYVSNLTEKFADGFTSVNENQRNNNSMMIYPNPVRDNLFIKYRNDLYSSYNLKIINAMGQEVFNKDCNVTQNVIEVSSLKSGIYFLQIITTREVMSAKFIKE